MLRYPLKYYTLQRSLFNRDKEVGAISSHYKENNDGVNPINLIEKAAVLVFVITKEPVGKTNGNNVFIRFC